MRELSKVEKTATINFLLSQIKYRQAGKNLKEAFSGYIEFINDNDFDGAKEYLQPMPESTEKTLMFRKIIITQRKYNEKSKNNKKD